MNWKDILSSGLILFGGAGFINGSGNFSSDFERNFIYFILFSMIIAGTILSYVWRKKKK